jgi:uroporphyrinogen decarboxylase
MIPRYEEKVLEHEGGHLIVQDWKGNICEISDRFDVTYLREAKDFVTRRWIRCPVEGRPDWERMRQRYRLDSPGRLPADFADRCLRAAGRTGVLRVTFPGPFWQMREWCGLEGLCLLMIEDPEFVDAMAAFWTVFVASMLERIFAGAIPDTILICEDMAYKGKSMISPAMIRRFCLPAWRRWSQIARSAGAAVLEVDSDGYVGELIPLWIEAGLNACSPVEVAAGCDVADLRRRFGRRLAFRGGVDKRCMARGGEAIRRDLARIEPVVREGGYIPTCDHGVPSDVSWPNFVDYAGLLARLTGWL